MKKIFCMLTSLLFFLHPVTKADQGPVSWGKVDQRDLKLTSWEEDPDAAAVILFDYGTLTIGPRTVYTRHYRIKILKEEGLKYATIRIPYRAHNQYETFTEFRAQTLSPDENGKIRRIKNRPFEDIPVNSRYKERTFTFPEAAPGTILEYQYTLVSLDFVKPDDWAFRHSIPCIWSEFRVNIPSDFHYLVTLRHKPGLSMEQQKQFASSLEWLYSISNPREFKAVLDSEDMLFSASGQRTTYFLSGRSMRFLMQNQPAVPLDAKGQPDEDEYPLVQTHLFYSYGYFPFWYKHLLLSADEDYDALDRSGIRSRLSRALSYIQYHLPTWQEMNAYWQNSPRFGKRYEKDPTIPEKLANIAGKGENERETLERVFETVQRTVSWNGEYSMYSEQTPERLFRSGTGTSGDINLLLGEILRFAGFEADPVLVKTSFGRPENLYPVRGQFDHVVIRVNLRERTLYLDASRKGKGILYLSDEVHGALGWVVSGNGEWVDVENSDPSIRSHRFAYLR